MAKRNQASRSGSQSRRNVMLVRDGAATRETTSQGVEGQPSTAAQPATDEAVKPSGDEERDAQPKGMPPATAPLVAESESKPVAAVRAKPAPPASKPASAKPDASALKPSAGPNKAQARSIARAQAVQRNRVAGLIDAENYQYVRSDLALTVSVAGAMVVLMVIMTFVLPNYIH